MASKKGKMKGGFFDQFDMIKILNYGELVNANQTSTPNTIDFLKEAKPVTVGLDKDSGTIFNNQNNFLPQYGGSKKKPKQKPKSKK